MDTENWVDIPGYVGLYQASDQGYIRSSKTNRALAPRVDKDGYLIVCLHRNGSQATPRVHRIIAICFIQNPFNLPHVNHKNGIKTDNRVVNVEWCTISYNLKHAYATGLRLKSIGKDSKLSLKVLQYTLSNNFVKEWDCIRDISRELRIDQSNICKCCRGSIKTLGGFVWKYKTS